MPNFTIHPATKEAAIEVASNLRIEDRREIEEGWGLNPTSHLPELIKYGNNIHFTAPNGKTAGLGGIYNNEQIWLVTTPAIYEHPKSFARLAKQIINSRTEPLLWNIADKRNTVHLRLLKFLGFTFTSEIKHGPHNLTFIGFYKCAYQEQCLQD